MYIVTPKEHMHMLNFPWPTSQPLQAPLFSVLSQCLVSFGGWGLGLDKLAILFSCLLTFLTIVKKSAH